jgi:hypothetical protein
MSSGDPDARPLEVAEVAWAAIADLQKYERVPYEEESMQLLTALRDLI